MSSSLVYIQKFLTHYVSTTYATFGTIGVLFNIAIFSQLPHRQSPTSLYILAMSLCSLISLSAYLIPTFYALDHPDPSTTPPFSLCQLIYYLRHSFNQMMRSFMVLACADRYAICSNQVRIRSFSQYRIAIRVIPAVMLFWLLLSIFPLTLRSLVNGVCSVPSGLNTIMFSTYGAIVAGILPLSCMIIFGILLSISLKKMRGRIHPMPMTNASVNQLLRKRDRDMLRMLLIEVICYATTTGPLAVLFIYLAATQTIMKSSERLQIESFLQYFTTQFLLYLTNSLSFWIYITVSRSFRSEFKKLILKCYTFITGKQIQNNELTR
jgi:hypothetical protein